MTAERRYLAGHANYRGDMTSIVGELKGPTTFGKVVVATRAEFDAEADRTRVRFETATPADIEASVPRDVHGALVVPGVGLGPDPFDS